MERLVLIYIFLSFSAGFACLGVLVLLAKEKSDGLTRRFLWLFTSLSLLVASGLALAFVANVQESVDPRTLFVVEYLESFLGRYSLMFTLPFFAHSVYGADPRRDRWLAAIAATGFALQHATEFAMGPVWDTRGDVAEDIAFAGIVVYTVWVGVSGLQRPEIYRPLAVRFLVLLTIGLPLVLHDLFLADGSVLRLYPLWYCAVSVIVTMTLYRRRHPRDPHVLSGEWGLSAREVDVVRLVQEGLSNRDIAETLHISTNTVKTHLQAVFTKTGFRSRFSLISGVSAPSRAHDRENQP